MQHTPWIVTCLGEQGSVPKRQHAMMVGQEEDEPRVVVRRLSPRGAVAAPSHPVARQAVFGDYLVPTANLTLGQQLGLPADVAGLLKQVSQVERKKKQK